MDRVEKALENQRMGCNCSQAIGCAFCDIAGIDEGQMFGLMEGFGLGGGDMQGTCGAVSGAAAVIGMLTSSCTPESPVTKQKTMKAVRALAASFREKNGSTICKDLKGAETGKVLRSCSGCVEDAAKLLQEYIDENGF